MERNRATRLARYEEMVQLSPPACPISTIAREMGLDRRTVHHFANAPSFPERAPRAAVPSHLDAMKLLQRVNLDEKSRGA